MRLLFGLLGFGKWLPASRIIITLIFVLAFNWVCGTDLGSRGGRETALLKKLSFSFLHCCESKGWVSDSVEHLGRIVV